MRSTRVFFLLLSLLQFIFFLKLVEYVRGAEIPNSNRQPLRFLFVQNDTNLNVKDTAAAPEQGEDSSRGLFIAPKIKRKKLRPWSEERSGISTNASGIQVAPNLESKTDSNLKVNQDQGELQAQGRLCPACENNQCAITTPISAGFPIIPIVVAVLVAVGWFILFLIFWLFFIKPDKESGGYDSGGYGSAQQSSYGPPQMEGKPSIFDHFSKPHERSFTSFPQMMTFVLDAIGKLTDLYQQS